MLYFEDFVVAVYPSSLFVFTAIQKK